MNLTIKGYHLKVKSEFLWALLVMVVAFVSQTLSGTDFHHVESWHTWLTTLLAGAIRLVWGALMAAKADGEITWS